MFFRDVTLIKLFETGEVRNYINFLFYRPNILERTVFAAPFIKDEPLTENLTIKQKWYPHELEQIAPAGQVFHHIVLKYLCCDTAEEAYLWAKQFLRDADIKTFCIIIIHGVHHKPYHAHILISPEYPMKVPMDDPELIETDEMLRQWEDATLSIPGVTDPEMKERTWQTILFDESKYSPGTLVTL